MEELEENQNTEFVPEKEELVENQQPYFDEHESVRQKIVNEYQFQKGISSAILPETSIETAHILLQNSKTSELMPEIDKEIKLSNLDSIEKQAIHQFTKVYLDSKWVEREQKKKLVEAKIKNGKFFDLNNDEALLETIEESMYDERFVDFDSLDALRRTRGISTCSRGFQGFEREKQVQTIIKSDSSTIDKTEQRPGFLQKMWGGFKK